jgi:hypothetical protein
MKSISITLLATHAAAFPSLRNGLPSKFNCDSAQTRLACLALRRKCCRDPNGEPDSMCLLSCPEEIVMAQKDTAMFEYVVNIQADDDLSVQTTGEPKDWAATWTSKSVDSGLELDVSINDEDGDAYVTLSTSNGDLCELDLGINLNTFEPMVDTMVQNGLACEVGETKDDDGLKTVMVSVVPYDNGNLDCRQQVVGAAGLPCLPTMIMATEQKQEPVACKVCDAVYRGYKTIISKENVTVAALENLGQTMCHTFDIFGSTQDQVCDIIINATSQIREAIVNGITPNHVCEKVVAPLNVSCA